MILVVIYLISIYLVDTLLAGIAFYALKVRFNWNIPPRLCFWVLLAIFAILDTYIIPFFYLLDVTITIGNEEIAAATGIKPDTPVLEFFDSGFFEFLVWSIQAFLAALAGDRLMMKK